MMERLRREGSWDRFKDDWKSSPEKDLVWSMWSKSFVTEVSKLQNVDHVVTLGSVLAIALKDPKGSGKTSKLGRWFILTSGRIYLDCSSRIAESFSSKQGVRLEHPLESARQYHLSHGKLDYKKRNYSRY